MTTTSSTMTTSVTTTTTTSGPMCGNGVAEPGEQCDGPDLAGATCLDFGYVNPDGVFCTDGCQLDYGFCEPECGNGTLEPDESCDDGNLVDGDGCSSTCLPEGGTCGSPIAVPLTLGTTVLSGSTLGGADSFQPQQSNDCSDGSGPDLVYEITPTEAGFLTAWIPAASSDFDSMLYFRTDCTQQASQTLCHDNFNTPNNAGGEVLSTLAVPGVPIYLVVDGWGGAEGSFELSLDLSTGEDCNDPVPIVVEGVAAIRAVGSTSGFASQVTCTAGFGVGPDVVYQVTVDADDNYNFDLNAGYNSVLNARTSCGDFLSEIGCDSPSNSNDSSLNLQLDANQTAFVWVDGTMGQAGTYLLRINQ